MKIERYIILLLLVVFCASGCYKDKGNYNTPSWTSIVSIDMTLDGYEKNSTYDILEGDVITCSPVIEFKSDVDQSKIEYRWVLHTDTISRSKELNWTAALNPKIEPEKILKLFLQIENKATGELWQQQFMSGNGVSNVRIVDQRAPKVGIFVYQKSDNTIEYGSIRGTSKTAPKNFNTIYTELYSYSNPTRSAIQGPLVAATTTTGTLVTYSNIAPDYGALVSITARAPSTDVPAVYMGEYLGNVAQQVFMGEALKGNIISANVYYSMAVDLLVGNNLYIGASDVGAFIPIRLNTAPTKSGVAQVMPVNPDTHTHTFGVCRLSTGVLVYYPLSKGVSYWTTLKDGAGANIIADEIVGVFRQPKSNNMAETKLFVAIKKGSEYFLYGYKLTPVSSNWSEDVVAYQTMTNVTSWADGMTSEAVWFTNSVEVPMNFLYVASGNKLWRTSTESLAAPTAVMTFDNPISTLYVALGGTAQMATDRYTAVFTYDDAAKESKLHILDLRGENITPFTDIAEPIPGKVIRYIPMIR